MTTHESVAASIKQIFDNFEQYLNIYCSNTWPEQSSSTETAKNCFKLGSFIEATVENFENKHCLLAFMSALNCYLKSKNYARTFGVDVYKNAGDHLLKKFFTTKGLSTNSVDVAVRIYTTMYPKERFEAVLNDTLLQAASFNAIKEYVYECKCDLKELESRLLMNTWADDLECGCSTGVQNTITKMFSSYNIEKSLPLLIKMLSLNDLSRSECLVKDVILTILLDKMKDRSVLSRNFWTALFKNVKCGDLCSLCSQYKQFFIELLNFIVYIGSMMIMDENLKNWIPDLNVTLCPEITYEELISVIKNLCAIDEDSRKFVLNRMRTAQNSVGLGLWEQIDGLFENL